MENFIAMQIFVLFYLKYTVQPTVGCDQQISLVEQRRYSRIRANIVPSPYVDRNEYYARQHNNPTRPKYQLIRLNPRNRQFWSLFCQVVQVLGIEKLAIVHFVATPLKGRFVVFLKLLFIVYFRLVQVILGQVIAPHGQAIGPAGARNRRKAKNCPLRCVATKGTLPEMWDPAQFTVKCSWYQFPPKIYKL